MYMFFPVELVLFVDNYAMKYIRYLRSATDFIRVLGIVAGMGSL